MADVSRFRPASVGIVAVAFAAVLLLVVLDSTTAGTDRLLALADFAVVDRRRPDVDCVRLRPLTRRQKVLCRDNVELMSAVVAGIRTAVDECQNQFADARWNCGAAVASPAPTTAGRKRVGGRFDAVADVSALKKTIRSGIREGAFLQAMISAGMMLAVTRACSSGTMIGCTCDRSTTTDVGAPSGDRLKRGTDAAAPTVVVDGRFDWGGCSDNVHYASAFVRTLTESGLQHGMTTRDDDGDGRTERRRTASAAVRLAELHNDAVGRMAVDAEMMIKCKCHGVSGSCELRTCWRSTGSVRRTGDRLHVGYESAIKVRGVHIAGGGSSDGVDARQELVPVLGATASKPEVETSTSTGNIDGLRRRLGDDVLVYVRSSLDFCRADAKTGSRGTGGRVCRKIDAETTPPPMPSEDSCAVMCCGRGHVTVKRTVAERCRCRFTYCCSVHCETCHRTVAEHVCL